MKPFFLIFILLLSITSVTALYEDDGLEIPTNPGEARITGMPNQVDNANQGLETAKNQTMTNVPEPARERSRFLSMLIGEEEFTLKNWFRHIKNIFIKSDGG